MTSRSQRDARSPLVVDEATSARLGRIRQRGTGPELRVRAMLRELGVRHGQARRRLPGSPDLVNVSAGWCIFVHGCFWHAHAKCPNATVPKRNRSFWLAKLGANRARDARVLREVRRLGFKAIVIWECDLRRRSAVVQRRLGRFLSASGP